MIDAFKKKHQGRWLSTKRLKETVSFVTRTETPTKRL
jgi:hypothetical protein